MAFMFVTRHTFFLSRSLDCDRFGHAVRCELGPIPLLLRTFAIYFRPHAQPIRVTLNQNERYSAMHTQSLCLGFGVQFKGVRESSVSRGARQVLTFVGGFMRVSTMCQTHSVCASTYF